jgi:hypothetical protein
MSISDAADELRRLTPRELVWAVALTTAVIAVAADPHRGIIDLVIRAFFSFVGAALVALTLVAIRGAPVDRRAILAYLPLASAALTFYLAKLTASHVTKAGSLDPFFEAATSLLGLLLVSLVVEARRVAGHDQWLRALRGWWVAFIIVGILYALLGLTPGRRSQQSEYGIVWAGLVGAVVALTVVMWRDPAKQPALEIASSQKRVSANGLTTGAASTSTRTRARSTPASRQAARR